LVAVVLVIAVWLGWRKILVFYKKYPELLLGILLGNIVAEAAIRDNSSTEQIIVFVCGLIVWQASSAYHRSLGYLAIESESKSE
jgi:hypothetical protein